MGGQQADAHGERSGKQATKRAEVPRRAEAAGLAPWCLRIGLCGHRVVEHVPTVCGGGGRELRACAGFKQEAAFEDALRFMRNRIAAFINLPLNDWGRCETVSGLQIDWNIPSQESMAAAQVKLLLVIDPDPPTKLI